MLMLNRRGKPAVIGVVFGLMDMRIARTEET
jgi:hypothetical protein